MGFLVPFKFAQALADVAGELKQEDQTLEELKNFSELLDSNRELMEALTHPAIPFSAKRNIVQELAGKIPLTQTVVNFIFVLIERARLPQLQDVIHAYEEILDELHGMLRADVFASAKVEKAVDQRLQKAISKLTEKKVKVNYHVDESLIGGFKLKIGSTIYDGSIGTQLEEFRRRLSAS